MSFFINGISSLSPQKTFNNDGFLDEIISYSSQFLSIVKPNYEVLIPKNKLIRFSSYMRMGFACAKLALDDAGNCEVDAIVIGSRLGSLVDKNKFLKQLLKNNETLTSPTSFIYSTHNTIGSQIALALNSNAYNITYSNKNTAFEISLLDSQLLFNEKKACNILVGAVDEITQDNYDKNKILNIWKEETIINLELFKSNTKGCLPGEGASFFILSQNKNENSYAKFIDALLVHEASQPSLISKLKEFLGQHFLSMNDIDIVICGKNGDKAGDEFYNNFCKGCFPNALQVVYKHLIGEHGSASSFALWLGSKILKTKSVPYVVQNNPKDLIKYRNVLLFNFDSFERNDFSFILLSNID